LRRSGTALLRGVLLAGSKASANFVPAARMKRAAHGDAERCPVRLPKDQGPSVLPPPCATP